MDIFQNEQPKMSQPQFEVVTERIGRVVTASTLRDPTPEDYAEATKLHAEGKCPHTIVSDMAGWPYDIRECVICGQCLGLI